MEEMFRARVFELIENMQEGVAQNPAAPAVAPLQIMVKAPGAEEINRNDPCPCGSGKKWKNCGLKNTEEHQRLMAAKK
jgi:uncharacterized protein YecA (UPF0149 family)